jgi:hypothetical protein
MIPLGSYAGMRIIEDRTLVDVVEDWSRVRSPSRARRRRKLGHPQRIYSREVPREDVYVVEGHTMIMHPEAARKLRRLVTAGPAA